MRIRNGTSRLFWENGVYYTRVFPGTHPQTKKPEDCFLQYGNHMWNQLQTFVILIWKRRHISWNNSAKYVCVSSLLLSKCEFFYLWLILCTLFLDEYYAWTANQTLFLRHWVGPSHWRCLGTVLARISLGKKTLHTYQYKIRTLFVESTWFQSSVASFATSKSLWNHHLISCRGLVQLLAHNFWLWRNLKAWALSSTSLRIVKSRVKF